MPATPLPLLRPPCPPAQASAPPATPRAASAARAALAAWACMACLTAPAAQAQEQAPPQPPGQAKAVFGGGKSDIVGPPRRGVADWLGRLQKASRTSSYVGTFVVFSATGAMSSSRIWHVCDGEAQIERIEALSGVPRSTFRHNETVTTFWPQRRVVKTDRREPGTLFPNFLDHGHAVETADYYDVREAGQDRVAGFDADIVLLSPRDALRFGYRIWSEKHTGLVIKTQTLDAQGQVLEQAAFSELQLQAPIKASQITRMMNDKAGYQVKTADRQRTTAEAAGWALRAPVPGFAPQSYYRRTAHGAQAGQWIFSDGLATVSLFIEPFDGKRHVIEGAAMLGATHTLTQRLSSGNQDWWITAMGEVPPSTLQAFIGALQRHPPPAASQ